MRRLIAFAVALAPLVLTSIPADARSVATKRKPDLADMIAGTYEGSVTSDVRGSSQTDVTVTVTRVGKNVVHVQSDYARIPTVNIPLTRPADTIQSSRSPHGLLMELNRDRNRLDLSIDQATLVVRRS